MAKFRNIISLSKRLLQQRREITQLREENATLRAQNDSMRQGMRRCVTCDYRIDFKQRQDSTTALASTPQAPPTGNAQ
jgi:cell division protein FtsB